MGYYTYYSGQFDITPPLTKPEYQRLSQVVDFWNSEDIKKAATADVFAATWEPLTTEDKRLLPEGSPLELTFNLEPDAIKDIGDSAKGYNNEAALPVVAQWLKANGHQLSGVASWDGEEGGDTGEIYAAVVDGHNRVEFVQDQHANPGPSWARKEVTT